MIYVRDTLPKREGDTFSTRNRCHQQGRCHLPYPECAGGHDILGHSAAMAVYWSEGDEGRTTTYFLPTGSGAIASPPSNSPQPLSASLSSAVGTRFASSWPTRPHLVECWHTGYVHHVLFVAVLCAGVLCEGVVLPPRYHRAPLSL